jgi:hypothetical protein
MRKETRYLSEALGKKTPQQMMFTEPQDFDRNYHGHEAYRERAALYVSQRGSGGLLDHPLNMEEWLDKRGMLLSLLQADEGRWTLRPSRAAASGWHESLLYGSETVVSHLPTIKDLATTKEGQAAFYAPRELRRNRELYELYAIVELLYAIVESLIDLRYTR